MGWRLAQVLPKIGGEMARNKGESVDCVILFLKERAKIGRRRKGLINQISSGKPSPGSIE
jgi:hypothetical protein